MNRTRFESSRYHTGIGLGLLCAGRGGGGTNIPWLDGTGPDEKDVQRSRARDVCASLTCVSHEAISATTVAGAMGMLVFVGRFPALRSLHRPLGRFFL